MSDDDLRAAVAAGVLASEDSHRALLQATVEVARGIFYARASSVLLYDERTDELVFEAVAGEGSDSLIGERLPSSTGIGGWVLVTRQPIVLDDVSQDPRFAEDAAKKTGFVPKGLMCVPLIHGEEPLGVLYVLDRPQQSRFSLEEMELLGPLRAPGGDRARPAPEGAPRKGGARGRGLRLRAPRSGCGESRGARRAAPRRRRRPAPLARGPLQTLKPGSARPQSTRTLGSSVAAVTSTASRRPGPSGAPRRRRPVAAASSRSASSSTASIWSIWCASTSSARAVARRLRSPLLHLILGHSLVSFRVVAPHSDHTDGGSAPESSTFDSKNTVGRGMLRARESAAETPRGLCALVRPGLREPEHPADRGRLGGVDHRALGLRHRARGVRVPRRRRRCGRASSGSSGSCPPRSPRRSRSVLGDRYRRERVIVVAELARAVLLAAHDRGRRAGGLAGRRLRPRRPGRHRVLGRSSGAGGAAPDRSEDAAGARRPRTSPRARSRASGSSAAPRSAACSWPRPASRWSSAPPPRLSCSRRYWSAASGSRRSPSRASGETPSGTSSRPASSRSSASPGFASWWRCSPRRRSSPARSTS